MLNPLEVIDQGSNKSNHKVFKKDEYNMMKISLKYNIYITITRHN